MYRNLKAEIARKRLKMRRIAREAKIPESSFRRKMTGGIGFTMDEAVRIYDLFFPDEDMRYLFDRDTDEQEKK